MIRDKKKSIQFDKKKSLRYQIKKYTQINCLTYVSFF